MNYISRPYFFIIFLILIIISCNDHPTDNAPEEISNQGTLTYEIIEYDNSPHYNRPVTVIYKNLNKEMIIDTVQTPWKKSFEYNYTTVTDSLADFGAHFIVQYEGEDIAVKAIISAEKRTEEIQIGNSFTINLTNVFKLPK